MSKGRDQFVAMLARELSDLNTYQVADVAAKLMRYGRTSSRLAVAECNRGMTDAERKQDERNDKRIKELVATFGKGFGVVLGGDPRGYTVKLLVPSGAHNTMGGKEGGWGVPNS